MDETTKKSFRGMTEPHPPAAGLVRVGPLSGLGQLLRDLGCDPRPVLESQGLTPDDFADPDSTISYVRAGKLLASSVLATGCPHLGLLLGQRIQPPDLGMPGYLLHTATDVGNALLDLQRHFDLHDRGGGLILDTTDGVTCLGYVIYLPGVEAADQIYDLCIAAECNVMRSLCGVTWRPSGVRLARSAPRNVAPYEHFFQAPIQFDAVHSAMVFPSRWLDQRISSSNSMLHRRLEREAESLHFEGSTDLVERVRALLHRALATRKADAPHIARQLGLHERTLSRHLRRQGTSFRKELNNVRYQLARELLANTSLPLSRIAAALDYSDTSAFVRAFRQWSGLTPTTWRRRHEK